MDFRNKWFKLLCHQREDRSYHICGGPMAFCSRCFGIYMGTFVTMIVLLLTYGLFTQGTVTIFAFAFIAPLAIDGLAQLFKKIESNNSRRFVTGYLAGFALSYFVYVTISRTFFGAQPGQILPGYEGYLAVALLVPTFFIVKKAAGSSSKLLKNVFDWLSVSVAFFLVTTIVLVYGAMFVNLVF